MSNKEILAIYKKAEKHWSRPIWLCKLIGWNHTKGGLCVYFQQKHRNYYFISLWECLWIKYKTTFDEPYHFNNRKERLEAIRKVIKDLEVEI